MATGTEDKKLPDKPPRDGYRKSIQIAPELRKRLAITASFGGDKPEIRLVLSGTEGCGCSTSDTEPEYETHGSGSTTGDPYPGICTDAPLRLTLLDVTLIDEGLGLTRWMYEVQTFVVPNGIPAMIPIGPTLVVFQDPGVPVPQNVDAFLGIGGFCGTSCPDAFTNQTVTAWSETPERLTVAGSTAAFESLAVDHVYSVEVVVIHPKAPLRRARLWFRFLISKTC